MEIPGYHCGTCNDACTRGTNSIPLRVYSRTPAPWCLFVPPPPVAFPDWLALLQSDSDLCCHSKLCHDPHGRHRFCFSSPIERRDEVRYRIVSSPATLEVCSGASLLHGALSFHLILGISSFLFPFPILTSRLFFSRFLYLVLCTTRISSRCTWTTPQYSPTAPSHLLAFSLPPSQHSHHRPRPC